MPEELVDCHDDPDHDYIEELKIITQEFMRKPESTTYSDKVQKLDNVEAREAAGSMNDVKKEIFSCDLTVARKWIKQIQEEERAEPKEDVTSKLTAHEVLQKRNTKHKAFNTL